VAQQAGSRAVDPKALTGADALNQRQLAELVVGIRLDSVPTGEAQRLAAEGKFYPLTVNANGFLRVVLPEGTEVKTQELEALLRIETLMGQMVDLLHELN
jgi:hypothetical protein